MIKEKYIVRAPGKLVLLGEYAVLEKNVPAIVTAIDKHIYCHISESKNNIVFTSKRINISKIQYEYKHNKMHLLSDVSEMDVLSFSKNAMEITLRYLEEKGYKLKNFEINILSDLSNKYGVKFGFGSSAAVTVSIIGAILYLHGVDVNNYSSREIIFKLGAISHFISQGSGSGLDVAASTFGGMFIYKSYTTDWMRDRLKRPDSLSEIIKEPWKFLYYEKINLLIDLFLCVGWTGKSSSTKSLLEQVTRKVKYSEIPENVEFYQNFLKTTTNLVNLFVHGIKNDKRDMINKAVALNRNLLKELARRSEVEMETESLKLLIGIAKKLGFEAKFSGAGGGDCGFAVVFDEKSQKALKSLWKKYELVPVDFNIEELGVCETSFAAENES